MMRAIHRAGRRLMLRWWYAYEMVNAYLAANMGEMDVAAGCESAAGEAERRLAVLSIQS